MIFQQICQIFLIYTVKKHLTHEICQTKFGRVKGALYCGETVFLPQFLLPIQFSICGFILNF